MSQKKFVPKKGQVDYSDIRYCPVINCVIKHEDKIFMVQRSNDMNLYPGYWAGINGFLDDHQDIEQKVAEELSEEAGLSADRIIQIKRGRVLVKEAPEYGKTWIVFTILVEVATDKMALDWEAQTGKWMSPAEALKMKLLPGYDQVIKEFF